jgi:uncharacterized protein YqgC (DUF456 family)
VFKFIGAIIGFFFLGKNFFGAFIGFLVGSFIDNVTVIGSKITGAGGSMPTMFLNTINNVHLLAVAILLRCSLLYQLP